MPTEAENNAAMKLQAPLPADVKPEEPPTPLATIDTLPSFESIVKAVAGGKLSADGVATLMEVYLKRQEQLAEQAYNAAFAAFQKDCPMIPRTSKANIATASGAGFSYSYADIETIMRTIGSTLTKHGLSVSFEDVTIEGGMLTATCRCSHIGGHSRESSSTVPTESKAGMSPQQKFGAAATYAQRRALSQRLGLWTGDPDTDGAGEPPQLLTEQQREHIAKLVEEAGADWSKVLEWWCVPNLEDACQDKYEAAIRFLKGKIHWQTKGKT